MEHELAVERLAQAVRQRRATLGYTQEDVSRAGGPSTAHVRSIEYKRAQKHRPKTLISLDTALAWPRGTSAAIVDGELPHFWRRDAGGFDRFLEFVTKELHGEPPDVIPPFASQRERAQALAEKWAEPAREPAPEAPRPPEGHPVWAVIQDMPEEDRAHFLAGFRDAQQRGQVPITERSDLSDDERDLLLWSALDDLPPLVRQVVLDVIRSARHRSTEEVQRRAAGG